MFLTLGLLVFPSQLGDVAVEGTVLAVVVAVVARPLGVALATLFSGYTGRERLVLGWAGLRGAVPVVLATFPVIRGIPDSVRFFDDVFFAVVLSTLLQGTTFEPLARLLKVTSAVAALPRPLAETGTIRGLGAEVAEYPVGTADAIVGLRVRELGMPRRPITATQPVHTVRPWSPRSDDGDQSHPARLGGVTVIEQLRTRRDGRPGALVLLEDGRYGVSGAAVIIGGQAHVQDAARRKIRQAASDSERAWWREVVGALAAPEP